MRTTSRARSCLQETCASILKSTQARYLQKLTRLNLALLGLRWWLQQRPYLIEVVHLEVVAELWAVVAAQNFHS